MKVIGLKHLTHGYKLSFSGTVYDAHFYGVDRETEMINYDEVRRIALEVKPQLIIAGASAYSRFIDYKKFREIADEVGAYLLVDMAHVAGLVSAGLHPSPIPFAHVVTSTTHKTLRGPRGGIILTNDKEIAKKIDRSVFPGNQGGPLMHVIAGKAVAFKEALQPSFTEYQENVIISAKAMAEEFIRLGYRVISGGTDNHLMIIDVKSKLGITGLEAETVLGKVNITVNKNGIPFDTEKPMYTSGIRIGTPAMASKGFEPNTFVEVVGLIDEALSNRDDEEKLEEIKFAVQKIALDHLDVIQNYPLEDELFDDVEDLE